MAIVKNVKRANNLVELAINKRAKIRKINLSYSYLKRLNLIGVKKGNKIEKIGRIKNLLIFKIKKGIIILPKDLAKEIWVENE